MLRPLLIRPSSGWIQLSEKPYNTMWYSIIFSVNVNSGGGDEISFTAGFWGMCVWMGIRYTLLCRLLYILWSHENMAFAVSDGCVDRVLLGGGGSLWVSQSWFAISASYRAVNTTLLGYESQSVNAVQESNRCLFWDPNKTHKYSVGRKQKVWMLCPVVHKETVGICRLYQLMRRS
jgi:hypothetical protein